jgi:CubicO group peptidase (beta-lactamase class C family)
MKKIPFILVALVLQFCAPSKKTESIEDNIKKVETGLINPVYLEGDSTWTIETRMKHYHVPGVSIAVINNGKIEWSRTYGVMDEETKQPVTRETLFQAGSISKPVAAYAALKTTEEGKIDLNENVNTYLKTWKLPDNEFTKNKKVTLKHLLSHTGGLTVHGFLGYSPDLPLPTTTQVLDGTPPANSPPVRVDKIPEESFRYSGGGYTIMQQMLVDVEGKPFPEILKEKVLGPLRMNHSTYDQPLQPEQLQLAATGYLPDGTMTKGKRHTYPEMAAAGLWTTAEDLATFAINIQKTMLDDSGEVLSKAMTEKMLTPFVADFIGLGLFINTRKDDVYFGHGGWDEGFSSDMVAHKTKGYGVVILTNSNHPEFIEELIRSVAHTYSWSNYVPIYKKWEMDTTKFSVVTGRYKNTSDGLITVYNKGSRLLKKTLRGASNELFQISDTSYISRESEQVIQFKKNPKDGQLHILLVENGKQEFNHPQLKSTERVPHEFILEDNVDAALKGYQALLKANAKDESVNESNLNQQGYNLMNEGKLKLALAVFKVNMQLYPSSANVYDSYGEALAKNGDIELAITNYKKALAIDPKNKSTAKALAELQDKKKK